MITRHITIQVSTDVFSDLDILQTYEHRFNKSAAQRREDLELTERRQDMYQHLRLGNHEQALRLLDAYLRDTLDKAV